METMTFLNTTTKTLISSTSTNPCLSLKPSLLFSFGKKSHFLSILIHFFKSELSQTLSLSDLNFTSVPLNLSHASISSSSISLIFFCNIYSFFFFKLNFDIFIVLNECKDLIVDTIGSAIATTTRSTRREAHSGFESTGFFALDNAENNGAEENENGESDTDPKGKSHDSTNGSRHIVQTKTNSDRSSKDETQVVIRPEERFAVVEFFGQISDHE